MLITHDTRCALDAVVDLVNTAPEDETADGLADVVLSYEIGEGRHIGRHTFFFPDVGALHAPLISSAM